MQPRNYWFLNKLITVHVYGPLFSSNMIAAVVKVAFNVDYSSSKMLNHLGFHCCITWTSQMFLVCGTQPSLLNSFL